MKFVRHFSWLFYQHLNKGTQESSHHIILFALLMMVNFPLFGILWKIDHFQLNEEFILRLIGVFMCVLLLSHRFWQSRFQPCLPVLWYLTLLYCLPFFFSYLALLNHGSVIWLMNGVSATFFLLLVINVKDALILLGLGMGLGWLLFILSTTEIVLPPLGHELSFMSIFATFGATVIIGALFARDRERMHAHRLSDMRVVAGGLAFDLKAPLASIHLQTTMQKNMLKKMENVQLQADFAESLQKIDQDIQASHQLIKSRLHIIKANQIDTSHFAIHPIQLLLANILKNYPFKAEEKERIKFKASDDFLIWFEDIAFKNLVWHIIAFNLLQLKTHNRGLLEFNLVKSAHNDNFNYLYILNTNKNMMIKNMDKYFDAKFSEDADMTSLGLTNGKRLMKAAGGDILCVWEVSTGLQFRLKFPKVE